MPRQERPLESEDSPLLRFAGDLRRLRLRAGRPSYRELGKRTNYSAAALSEALSGRRLPSLAVTSAVVRACGGDIEEWTERWRRLAATQPGSSPATPTPYVGLAPYQAADADRFFGREAVTGTLVTLVDERPFVGVFGASGAGKSSLLRAGLVARSRRVPLLITPGSDPIAELSVAVASLADEPVDRVRGDLESGPEALRGWLGKAAGDVLLVVDQFEEAFTLCNEADRDWLIRALTSAAGPRARVVVGVRADFYGHCARHPELVTALHRAQVLLGPMSTEELRSAITEPAARAGATIETALIARLISDVTGQPASLPLVSHALTETWQRRRGMVVTLAGYEDVGGIEHALTRTAERIFNDLSEADRDAARLLFMRLVVPGDGTEDTKRRARRADLPVPGTLLERLAAARLITLDHDSVELTHEALLRAWPRLAGWIDRDRDALRAQHRLTEATAIWEAHDRDPDTLLRGARLEQAESLRGRLNRREHEFLDASLSAERARTRAGRRTALRLRRLAAGLTVLTFLLAGTVVLVVATQRRATAQRNEALSLRAADTARAMIAGRPRSAATLALAAYRLAPTAEAREVLILAHAAVGATILGYGYEQPPGRFAITYHNKTLGEQIWRRVGVTWQPAGTMRTAGSYLRVSSIDETRAIYWTESRSTFLWDLTDLDRPRRITVPSDLGIMDSLDRTGLLVGAVGTDKTARVWHVGDRSVRRLPPGEVTGTALLADGSGVLLTRRDGDQDVIERWSPDGRLIATLMHAPHPSAVRAGPARLISIMSYVGPGTATIMDLADPLSPRVVARADGLDETANTAFDASGRTVAVVDGAEARIWDVRTGAKVVSLRTQGLGLNLPRLVGRELFLLDTKSAVWHLDTDLNAAIDDSCAQPEDVAWDHYFPGTSRKELCPRR